MSYMEVETKSLEWWRWSDLWLQVIPTLRSTVCEFDNLTKLLTTDTTARSVIVYNVGCPTATLFYPAVEQPGWIGNFSESLYNQSYGPSYQSSAVVLHVSMCCEKCVEKVRKAIASVDDVESVDVEMDRQRVTVTGYVNAEKVLRKVRKVKKSATFWDSSHDYANYSTGAYDYYSSAYGYNSNSSDYNYCNPSSISYNYYGPSSYDSSYDYIGDNSSRSSRPSSYDAYRYL